MPDQPVFGRRLRELRTERGLTLAALAGEGMSAGYLSRLESGARRPTERAVAHLAAQLGISAAELTQSTVTTLARALTLATGLGRDEAGAALSEALKASGGEDPLLRWQALRQVAAWHGRRAEHAEQRARLDELVALSTTIALPELRARALAELSRCLRDTGETAPAVDTAARAHRLARSERLPAHVRVQALLALVWSLLAAGRDADAAGYAGELLTTAEDATGAPRAQALWAVATTRLRRDDPGGAAELLDRAVGEFDGRDDLTLWMRLRLDAARAGLLTDPPRTETARERADEITAVLPFAGSPAIGQGLLAVRARLAVATGRIDEARTVLDRLVGHDDLLTPQDRIGLDVLRHRVLLHDGERDTALTGLRDLAEQAQRGGDMSLAAEIWRLVAESLAA
ncbi:helix-turn-helix domain-containing protein [Streptomyces sp. NPDC087300]|uniref:helix-turn-helix domain-containing protein n=1 Tax=Streptomyces sp. NPDC087300 TaxID=3365780 RepID=UPI0037FA075F